MFRPSEISTTRRLAILASGFLTDIGLRAVSANLQHDLVIFTSAPELADMTSISAATGLAVPAIFAPLVVSPLLFALGVWLIGRGAIAAKLVAAFLVVGSFLCFTLLPVLSVLLAVLAYLVLASGLIEVASLRSIPEPRMR